MWRGLAWLIAAVVGVSTVAAMETRPAAAATPARAKSSSRLPAFGKKVKKVASRPDLVSAAVSARAQGSPVEAVSLRSATSTTWANPDGTVTTKQYAGPVRYKDTHGVWQSIDLNLSAGGGSVQVKRAPSQLSLAGSSKSALGTGLPSKGSVPLIAAKAGAKGTIAIGARTKLGAPKISGRRATYANVTTGADMAVQATRTGFESFLSVKDAAAVKALVASSGPDKGKVVWSFPVQVSGGVTAKQGKDGDVVFVDAKGGVQGRMTAPQAWDATKNSKSGLPANSVDATLRLSGTATAPVVSVVVDAKWATAKDRTFPITLDPTYASGKVTPSFDTYVQSNSTVDKSGEDQLRVGTYDGGSTKARSFMTLPVAAVANKQVISAKLNLYETWAYSCTARAVDVYIAGAASTSTRWTSQPNIHDKYASGSFAAGPSSCGPKWQTIDVTKLGQFLSTSGWGNAGLALKASETDSYGWKIFDSLEGSHPPSMTFTYNRAPNTAAAPTFVASGTYGGVGYVQAGKTKFSTKITDADGSKVKSLIEIHNSKTVSSSSLVASCTTPLGASGATISCTNTTDMANGGTFYARAKSTDELGLSASSWSGWTTIKRAGTAPAAPTVSCPGHANGSWTADAPGTDLTCTVSTSGSGTLAATTLKVYIDGSSTPAKTIDAKQAATSTTVTVPKAKGAHSVKAVAIGGANLSATTTSSFGWGQASLLTPVPFSSTSGKVKVSAAGQGNATPTATLQWRVSGETGATTGWKDATGASMTVKVAGGVATAATTWDSATADTDGAGKTAPDRTPIGLDLQVCFTYPSGGQKQCTWATGSPASITRLPHAFGNGYPTTDAGVGTVAQVTGELNTTDTDVTVPGMSGDLSISRSTLTFTGDGSLSGWPTDYANSMFGPGWTGNLDGPGDAGTGSMNLIDQTTVDGTMILLDDDGSALIWRQPSGGRTKDQAGTYVPVTQDTADAGMKLVVSGGNTVTVTEDDATATTYKLTGSTWGVTGVAEPGAAGTTTYTRDAGGKVTRILSGLPDGYTATDCPGTGALTKPGCRALDLAYNSTGQVTGITATLWDPTSSAMKTTPVASYSYDSSKRLIKEADPRTGLATQYGWDGSSTRLASVTPAGLAAYRITYDGAATAGGRVKQITRDPATTGGAASALFSFVYGVPTSGTNLPSLTSSDVAAWSQASAPATGYAVFGADHPVSSTSAASISAADWKYADLSYTDAANYEVNSATYGAGQWLIDSTDYDATGNTVRELAPEAINVIADWRDDNPDATASDIDTVSDFYSTQTVYNPDITDSSGNVTVPAGTRVVDTLAPAEQMMLADGTSVTARKKEHTDYDQNAPSNGTNPATGQPWGLPTTVTTTAIDNTGTSVQQLDQTVNGYNAVVSGDPTGWSLGNATTVTNGGITKTTRYDTAGRTIETRQPAATSTASAGTTRTVYYTAGANSVDAACGNTTTAKAWAGSVCRTFPGAAPSSGPSLPDSRTTGYSMWLNPTTVVETSGSANRTTRTSYDAGGRKVLEQTTGSIPGATPVNGSYTHYASATGLVDYTGVPTADGSDATSDRTSTGYDNWGRKTSYTSDTGDKATTSYTAAGGVGTVTDPKGTTTYTYDGTDADGKEEHRGVVTGLAVTRAGTGGDLRYKGAYDTAGTLTTEAMPGGITAHTATNLLKQVTGSSYEGVVTPVSAVTDPDTGETTWTPGTPTIDTWMAWSQDFDGLGRVARQYTGTGTVFDGDPGIPEDGDVSHMSTGKGVAYDKAFTYDGAGRLTTVTDRENTGGTGGINPDSPDTGITCQTRTYAFTGAAGSNGNRTKLTTASYAGDTGCTGDAASSTSSTWAYDDADRATTGANGSGSYTYDAFGRQTSIPAADTPTGTGDLTVGYYLDDSARTITQGAQTTTFTLDDAGRRATQTTTSGGNNTSTVVRHYTDDGDNPSWTVTTAGGKDTSTRYTDSVSGDFGAQISDDGTTTIALTDPQGNADTSITLAGDQTSDTAVAGINDWTTYTEYGAPTAGTPGTTNTTTGTIGYGWLGQNQRATTPETAGLTLMGARLYDPVTGRFTSTDPVPGGNDNTYTYPLDPINNTDITGQWGWPKWRSIRRHLTWKNAARVAAVGGFGVCVFMSAGACLAAGIVGSVVSARASAGRFGGRKFRRSFASNLAYTALGYGVGKGLAKGYQISGGARYSSQGIRRSLRGYRAVKKWKYRRSYYWHSAKLNAMQSYMSNRWGW